MTLALKNCWFYFCHFPYLFNLLAVKVRKPWSNKNRLNWATVRE